MFSDHRQHFSWKYSTVVLVVGLIIGYVGLDFVSRPPSAILVQQTKHHANQTEILLDRITSIETMTLELKKDVEALKTQIKETH